MKINIVLDENNRIKLWGQEGCYFLEEKNQLIELPEDFDIFSCNLQNYCYINGQLQLDKAFEEKNMLIQRQENIRFRREKECFAYVDRGIFWYNKLSEEQKKELERWYNDWLKATETLIIPEKLKWLK